MNEENFHVQFIPSKHCFLQFSNKWFQKLNSPKCSCLKLIHPTTKEELWLTWAPQPSIGLNDCSVGINATFARALNLHESDLVVISSEEVVMSLRQVFLTPLSPDDYEILEMSRDSVEDSLLNQIRVVFVNQIISVWVSKTMHLKLTVDRLEPLSIHGRLEQMTELVIEDVTTKAGGKHSNISHSSFNNYSAPNTNNTSTSLPVSKQNHKTSEPTFWNLLSNFVPQSILDLLNTSEDARTEQIPQVIDNTCLVCRVHPFPSLPEPTGCCEDVHDEKTHPFNLFVQKVALRKDSQWPKNTFLPNLLQEQNSVVVCRLEAVPPTNSKQQSSANNEKSLETDSEQVVSVIVRLYKIGDSCEVFGSRTNISCVYVPLFLRRLLDLSVGSKVKLTAYNPPINILLTDIMLLPSRNLSEEEASSVCQQFIERLPTRGGVLVNNLCPFPVPQTEGSDNSIVLVQLSPDTLDCWPLTRAELQVCSITVPTAGEKSLEEYDEKHFKRGEIVENTLHKYSLFEQLVKEGVTTLEFGLRLVPAENQDMILDNILITGKQGSGKSRLAEAIYTKVAGPPYYVHVNVLDCKPLKGKKPESVGKIVAELLEDCIYHQPAVLVLDNLQCIAGAPTNDLEPSQETLYFLRLATVLKELLWRLRLSQCVSVIATAESRGQIHPQLLSARGRHSFTTFLHIPALDTNHRLRIFKELLSTKIKSCSELDLEDLVKKTEGCVAQDLCQLMDRVLFKACQRQTQADAELEVTDDDLKAALEGFIPSGLLNVALVRNTTHCFANVGGMDMVKELLTEVLIWPTKFPAVFSQCPLRLERGALLYGAPGTGKTLLANAVAGESGLNLITVKGPELLSKYIGASEEAVRNVFQKAQSAQPCILFFDEFDSLAPRRGHDSTGVTDRVVNQLLTQMDGVEALEGVWVVAAASRPDLLDPALLRPGRIGSLIHCPLPDKAERLSILQSLSSKLQLSADVDLGAVAARTDGFTGADLQAVLFTAQMTAYEALHQDSDEDLQVNSSPISEVAVNQNDLVVALETTNPSLKLEDRIKFQIIYERFQTSKEGSRQVVPEEGGLKVTLA